MSRKINIIGLVMLMVCLITVSASAAEKYNPSDSIAEMDMISYDDALKDVVQYIVLESTDSDDNYDIVVRYACDTSFGEGEKVNFMDEADVEKAFASLDEKTVPRILLSSESYSHGDHSKLLNHSAVKNAKGQYYLKLKYKGIPQDIYAMPVTTTFWRVINIYPDGSYENFAMNYDDTEKQRNEILGEITSYGNQHVVQEKTPLWAFLVILILVLIAVLTGMLINRRKRRDFKDRMENPAKYMGRSPQPGDILITLECVSCHKEYSIYIDPKDENYVRKNRKRCPECQNAQRLMMEDVSGRTWYIS